MSVSHMSHRAAVPAVSDLEQDMASANCLGRHGPGSCPQRKAVAAMLSQGPTWPRATRPFPGILCPDDSPGGRHETSSKSLPGCGSQSSRGLGSDAASLAPAHAQDADRRRSHLRSGANKGESVLNVRLLFPSHWGARGQWASLPPAGNRAQMLTSCHCPGFWVLSCPQSALCT